MEQIEVFPPQRSFEAQFRLFPAVRKVGRVHGEHAPAAVSGGIGEDEGNAAVHLSSPVEIPGIAVASLVGPAAFAVSGGFIGEIHIRNRGEIEHRVVRFGGKIPELQFPAGILKAEREQDRFRVGRNIRPERNALPPVAAGGDFSTGIKFPSGRLYPEQELSSVEVFRLRSRHEVFRPDFDRAAHTPSAQAIDRQGAEDPDRPP